MRLTVALLVIIGVSSQVAAETVLDYVTRPSIQAAIQKRQTPEGEEFVQKTGGVHEGHRVFFMDAKLAAKGEPAYAVRYNACLQPELHGSNAKILAKEGLSGIGLPKPSGANWYSGGFIDVKVNGNTLGHYRPRFERVEYEDGTCSLIGMWNTGETRVKLEFTQLAGDNRLFVTGEIEEGEIRSAEVLLRCFPGGFKEPRSRVIETKGQKKNAPTDVMLGFDEFWICYYDEEWDCGKRKGSGPCAVMFSRTEVGFVMVKSSNYSIETRLQLNSGVRTFHLILWEFSGMSNADAVRFIRETASGLKEGLGRRPTAAVRTKDVPPGAATVDGEPAATIVVRNDAVEREIQAAREIQDYVEKASGALLPIVRWDEKPDGRLITIEVREGDKGASKEGFSISAGKEGVELVGGSPLGALYAAYEFLERVVGVRWYLPGELGEVVPKNGTIILPTFTTKQSPSFPMRWIGTGKWMLRNKQNRCEDGFLVYPGIYHTQGIILPHSKYFDGHPEYFALVKGKRSEERQCKLCTSSAAVVREVGRNMAAMLDKNPNICLISFSPTDGMLYCECPDCKANDEPEAPRDQMMSRRMLLFYNGVAEEIAKTHPDAQMLVGAYHIYTWPPKDKSIKAHPMLNVIICHYEDYCLAHSMADANCPPNARYRDLIRQWQALGCKVYFYEYYWKVNWLDMPWPIVHTIRKDIPWFKTQDIQGVYTQYNTDNIWTLYPNFYVAARLLWDVKADVDEILSRMYRDLFGKAAPAIAEYYEVMENRVAACGDHFPGRGLQFGPVVFNDEVLGKMHRCYEEAVKLNDDPIVAKRLEKIGASIEYTERLMKYAKLRAAISAQPSAEACAETATEARTVLEKLSDEVLNDRKKWGGVVSTSVFRPGVYLGRELDRIRKTERKLRIALGKSIFVFPKQWRFCLDPEDVGQKEKWFAYDFDDSSWAQIEVGKTWEEQGYDYDGFAWYRLAFKAKPEWLKKKKLSIFFGAVDGEAWVYVNGELLGHHEGWDEPFLIPVKPELLQTDKPNLLAVRVWDGKAQGGIYRLVELRE